MFRLLKLLAIGGIAMFAFSACTPMLSNAIMPLLSPTAKTTTPQALNTDTPPDPISDSDLDAYRNLCAMFDTWTGLTGTYRTVSTAMILETVSMVNTDDPATDAFLKSLRRAVRANGDTAAAAAGLVDRECTSRATQ